MRQHPFQKMNVNMIFKRIVFVALAIGQACVWAQNIDFCITYTKTFTIPRTKKTRILTRTVKCGDDEQLIWSDHGIKWNTFAESRKNQCLADSRVGVQKMITAGNTGHVEVVEGYDVYYRVAKKSKYCKDKVIFKEYLMCCEL